MKDLKQITVIGLGLLGSSATLSVLRSFPGVKVVGYSHRRSTREKARSLCVASEVAEDMRQSVRGTDIVIVATPISTFEGIFSEIADSLDDGCIVTDVGSTKVLPHRWAQKCLPERVRYVGSHPIAGSEQRGVEFARDDLFDGAACILTYLKNTDGQALETLRGFWSRLGCSVESMSPAEHDRIYSSISHLPHVVAAALINANDEAMLKYAGKGFIDTSRIASGPANIWTDILASNKSNTSRGIDRVIKELLKLKKAIDSGNEKQINSLLEKARNKRAALIEQKIRKKELM